MPPSAWQLAQLILAPVYRDAYRGVSLKIREPLRMLAPRAPSGTLLWCGGTQPLILRWVPDPTSKNEKFLTCRPINTAAEYKTIVNRMTAMFNFLGINALASRKFAGSSLRLLRSKIEDK